MPEIDSTLRELEMQLEDLELEEAVRVRRP